MQFARIDAIMTSCKAHLDATGCRNTEIESFLVGYALVCIVSEFDLKLRAILEVRVARSGDQHIQSFASAAAKRLLQGMDIRNISGCLGKFSVACKKDFQDSVCNTPAHVAYDNIIANRHAIAHVTGSNMTFAELEVAVTDSKAVFDGACNALGLTPAEIATL